ncbi:S-phase kinase-associated protein 2-like [Stylophora pistillata]|uniref:S-phase kinase-associated protein 2-like n=1 Tax=Stylophora pistillata TaxID=50429 RepID=UPI000C0429E3|nr:S-phase kinase-associated protein 2-like [Stylophora pistillata]
MAAVRTKDQKRNAARTKRGSQKRPKKDVVEPETLKITCSFSRSKVDPIYKELGVSELKWPAADERELSQEIMRVNPLNRHSILQAPCQKFVVSHWGKTSCLVASGSSFTKCKAWKSGPKSIECTDCVHNRKRTVVREKPTPNYWMMFSDEIIMSIFGFLPKKAIVRCARVCKHWQRLVYDESLWHRVDMTKSNLLPGLLGKVLKRRTSVLRIAHAKVASPLCDDNAPFFPDVVPLSPKSPNKSLFNLRLLDATSCSFQEDTLLCLLMQSQKLTHVSLESCKVSTSILRAISELRNLEVLNLAMCTGVTITGICSLVKGGKNCRLKQLNLAWINLTKATIMQLIKNLPQLQQLNLSGCRETLTDDCIKQLVKSCPQLTHLDLSDGVLLTTQSLEAILKLKHLVWLGVSRCYSLPPVSFSLFTKLKSLKTLQLFGLLNTEGVEVLKADLPNVNVNKSFFSCIARPVGSRYSGKIWEVLCKD